MKLTWILAAVLAVLVLCFLLDGADGRSLHGTQYEYPQPINPKAVHGVPCDTGEASDMKVRLKQGDGKDNLGQRRLMHQGHKHGDDDDDDGGNRRLLANWVRHLLHGGEDDGEEGDAAGPNPACVKHANSHFSRLKRVAETASAKDDGDGDRR